MNRNNITCIYNIVLRKKLVDDEKNVVKEAMELYKRAKTYGAKHCVAYYYDFEDKDPRIKYSEEDLKKEEVRIKELNPLVMAFIELVIHEYSGESFDRVEGLLEIENHINHVLNVNYLTNGSYASIREIIKNYLKH